MAKKKVQNQENRTEATTHDDRSEQLASLKALNNLLVRETVERREQIDTLQRSKEALQSELARSIAETQKLEAEKSIYQDEIAASEIEQAMSVLIVSSELGQREEKWREKVASVEKMAAVEAEMKSAMTGMMKSMEQEKEELMTRVKLSDARLVESVRDREEIERAMAEKEIKITELREEVDGVRKGLDLHKKEAHRLRLAVAELEKSSAEGRADNRHLQMERDGLVKEKMEMGRRFDSLMEDGASMQRRLEESLQQFNDLKKELQDTVKAMDVIKRTRAEQDVEMKELQKEVGLLEAELGHCRDALDHVVRERDAAHTDLDRQKEETEVLISKTLELEKSNEIIEEELGHLRMERDGLVEEKAEQEKTVESLTIEKNLIDRSLKESLQWVEDLKKKIEEIVRDKEEIERVRAAREDEITQLQEEVGRLNASVSELQELCGDLTKMNRQLDAELRHQKDAFDGILHEKDGVLKDLDQQKQEAESLKMEVVELGKSNEETQEELGRTRTELYGLLEAKKERDRLFELLTEDRNSMEKSLVEARQGLNDLETRIKLAETLFGRALSMLKDTAEMVCEMEDGEKGGKGDGIYREEIDGEIQSFTAELEAIKRAFEIRARKVEEAREEIKSLQMSVAESQKRKNLWTWLSSATTILAAASVAYVARGR